MPGTTEASGLAKSDRQNQGLTPRAVAELLIVAVCTLAFALNAAGIAVTLLTPRYAGTRDFVTYWASGQQIAHHANPYDQEAIRRLELSVGYAPEAPTLIMRNAPPSLLLMLPLGFLGIRAASLLWSAVLLLSLWLSVRTIASMHHQPRSKLNFLAYGFAPALSCLITGQTALFVLLGLTLFLRFYRSQPFLAGVALWLCALKPQLFLPFALVLFVWLIATRSYKIFLGALLAFGLSSAVVLAMDPHVWLHYAQMMKAVQFETRVIPCLSTLLRLFTVPSAFWLQYLLAAVGCVWAILYLVGKLGEWNWMEHGSLLMLVSVTVAPYSWFMDQSVLLPGLLLTLYRSRSRSLIAVFALISAVIELLNIRGVPLGASRFYAWTPLAWLLWYLIANHTGDSLQKKSGVLEVPSEVTSVSKK
jgi:hypothetical protein